MTRALTFGMLLCALVPTVCDRRLSPNPPTLQASKAGKAATTLAKATAEFEYPASSGHSMIDNGTNRGSRQPARTNRVTAYATCNAQLHAVFDHCPSGQVFDQRFSVRVMKDACDGIKS